MGSMSDTGSTPSDPPADGPDGAESAVDATRRKFREALDRKKFGHHGGSASADPQARAPHSAPAKPQRAFRRKSG